MVDCPQDAVGWQLGGGLGKEVGDAKQREKSTPTGLIAYESERQRSNPCRIMPDSSGLRALRRAWVASILTTIEFFRRQRLQARSVSECVFQSLEIHSLTHRACRTVACPCSKSESPCVYDRRHGNADCLLVRGKQPQIIRSEIRVDG